MLNFYCFPPSLGTRFSATPQLELDRARPTNLRPLWPLLAGMRCLSLHWSRNLVYPACRPWLLQRMRRSLTTTWPFKPSFDPIR